MLRILTLFLALQAPGQDPLELPADLVLVDGKIATMENPGDFARAVAVRGRRIVRVGTNEEVRALVGPETKVLSLGGKLVLPGLVDSHVHFLSGSLSLDQLDVSRADLPEIQKRLVDGARSAVVFQRRAGRGKSERDVLAAPLPQKVRGGQRVGASGSEEKRNHRKQPRPVGHEG